MKYYIKAWCSLCVLISLLVSCNEDHNLVPTGTLYLNVEEDQTLQTRATSEVTYESLQVAILQGEEDTLKVYNDYLTEVKGQRLVLTVGKFTVAVRSNGADGVAWETPLYQGAEEVEVKQGEITNTKVICTIANTKVSVKYGDSVKDHFIDYQTTVSNTSGSLLFTRDEYRSGYFTPEKLTVQLKLVNNDGNEFILKRVYPDIQPQYHYTFKFTLSDNGEDDEAGADVNVTVDKEHKEITYDIFIKEEDELFGKGEPKMTLEGDFNADNLISFRKKEGVNLPEAALKLSVPNGIQTIQVKTSSWQFEDLSTFDLNTWANAEAKGFPSIDVKQIEQTLDFKLLIESLLPDGLKTATHKFTICVLDNLYQESEISFSIEVKPDVKVGIGTPIVWAKFAVLVGESEALEDVSFYFKKKGESEFETISGDAITTNIEKSQFTTLISNLEPGETYEYKALADGSETDWEEIVMEEAPMGKNMGFENWCEKDGLPMPWADGETPFWGCGNTNVNLGITTIKAIMTKSDNTDYKEGKLAAYMMSKTQSGVKFGAGNIFTGDFELSGTNGVLKLGRDFTGRPSQLTGFYKYLPGTEIKKGEGSHLNGEATDLCSIYIALTDNKITIDTGKPVYFDPSDEAIIAYGELPLEKCREQKEYTDFTIDLEYRDLNRTPKYIIIVASSSKYGDYFEGRENSQMWLDGLKLIYPNSLSEIKQAK